MPDTKNNKRLFILLGVLGVGIIIALFVLLKPDGSSSEIPSTGLVTENALGEQVSSGSPLQEISSTESRTAELVALLNSIQNIDLSGDIFKHEAFKALVDITASIPSDTNPGRPNPFFPMGIESQDHTGLKTLFFDTTQSGSASRSSMTDVSPLVDDTAITGDDAISTFLGTGKIE